jgi:hypothetical protein
MSCCGGGGGEDSKKNELITRQLKEDKRKLDNEVKLLLLGKMKLLYQ